MTYRIVRFYQDDRKERKVLETGLTLEQARIHCRDREASSQTATSTAAMTHIILHGHWFDGYEEEL